MGYREVYFVNSDGFIEDVQPVPIDYVPDEGVIMVEEQPHGILKGRWNGSTWEETATPEELEQHLQGNPPEKTTTELQLTTLQEAVDMLVLKALKSGGL